MEVYDTEHIPNLLKVPGVYAVTRIKGEPFAVSIGGAEQQVVHTGPRYSALYEIEGPHVLVSPAWPRPSNWAAGRARSGPTPAIGSTRSIRSASDRQLCSSAGVRDQCRRRQGACRRNNIIR